jgi:hypothetical protein
MLWRVYDDCIHVQRREFVGNNAVELGPDWVMPLPAAESKPFAFAERAKKVSAPQFAANAVLTVRETVAKNRGGRNRKNEKEVIEAVERKAYELVIPQAEGRDGTRALYYNVAAVSGKVKIEKRVLAQGFNRAPVRKAAKEPTRCVFAAEGLAAGKTVFTAVPVNSYGRAGKAISCKA